MDESLFMAFSRQNLSELFDENETNDVNFKPGLLNFLMLACGKKDVAQLALQTRAIELMTPDLPTNQGIIASSALNTHTELNAPLEYSPVKPLPNNRITEASNDPLLLIAHMLVEDILKNIFTKTKTIDKNTNPISQSFETLKKFITSTNSTSDPTSEQSTLLNLVYERLGIKQGISDKNNIDTFSDLYSLFIMLTSPGVIENKVILTHTSILKKLTNDPLLKKILIHAHKILYNYNKMATENPQHYFAPAIAEFKRIGIAIKAAGIKETAKDAGIFKDKPPREKKETTTAVFGNTP